MRHLATACLLFTLSCFSQQNITLPKDDGLTTSFCETMDFTKASSAKEFYDNGCTKISESHAVKMVIINGDEATAHMRFNEIQHGVYGKVTFRRSGRYVSYCIQDFKVNNMPYDEWVKTANSFAAEQIKGKIFSTVVLLIADLKNNMISTTQR